MPNNKNSSKINTTNNNPTANTPVNEEPEVDELVVSMMSFTDDEVITALTPPKEGQTYNPFEEEDEEE